MSNDQGSEKFLNDAIIKEISDAVKTLDYGDINIKVHNKKIVQIEVAERRRFDDVWQLEKGGGI